MELWSCGVVESAEKKEKKKSSTPRVGDRKELTRSLSEKWPTASMKYLALAVLLALAGLWRRMRTLMPFCPP